MANELHALSATDGRTLWSHIGITESAGLLGGGAPAVDDGIVDGTQTVTVTASAAGVTGVAPTGVTSAAAP